MAERSSIPERTCSPSWTYPSGTANLTCVQACVEAKERNEAEALAFMTNVPPTLPPSPPPMYTDGEHD
eukprot:3326621-Pleurochrysis_carterae.AAC.4